MKRTLLIAAIIFLAIVNVAALGTIAFHRFFHDGGPPPHRQPELSPGSGRSFHFLRQELSLTDEQIDQMQSERALFEQEMGQVRTELHNKRKALMGALKASEPDKTRIYQLVDEIGGLQLELEKQGIEHILRHRQILTPEQHEKFLDMFEHHFDKHGFRRGHGRGDRAHGPWRSLAPETRE